MLPLLEVLSGPTRIRARDEFSPLWFSAILLVFPPLIYAVTGATGTIIANEKGLRWRHWLRWKSASWQEIQDFYSLHSKESYAVETPNGKLVFAQAANSQSAALALLIVERATNTKAREWGKQFLREVDTEPQIFRYGNGENWFFGGLYPFFFGIPVFWPVYLLMNANRSFGAGWQMQFRLLLIGALIAFSLWLCLLAAFIYCVNWGRENWQRRHEILEVSPQGVVWRNDTDSLSVRWDEIHEFHVEIRSLHHQLYWLETAQGGIQFSGAISNINLLLKLMEKYSPLLGIERACRAEEKLRATDGQWSGGRLGLGSKTFHYRTRSNRAVIWASSALCIVIPLVIWAMPPDETRRQPPPAAWPIFLICAVPTLFMWLFYYRSALVISDEGLEKVGLLRRKFIAWPQVQELTERDGNARYVKSANQTIGILYGLVRPVDWEELKDEIARRAVNAEPNEWRER